MLVIGEQGLAVSRVLCIGAHPDDIEIGCGGSLLALLERRPGISVNWIVMSGDADRERETRAAADRILRNAGEKHVTLMAFRERYFRYDPAIKQAFDEIGRTAQPDLVLAPWRGDAHQDHQVVAELAANTFRDHLILEYEIPKYDGDLGRPAVFMHLTAAQAQEKVATLMDCFPSQVQRPWFSDETFRGLMRLRGIESRAPDGYAEAFHAGKLVLA